MKKRKCIIKGCGKDQHCRGLCKSCYVLANNKIRAKEVTDDELVSWKLILPKYPHKGAFARQFEQRKA